jgi:hypothetical protein
VVEVEDKVDIGHGEENPKGLRGEQSSLREREKLFK